MFDKNTSQLIVSFNDALNAHDVDGMMRLMAWDCVFENTFPAPDGTRYEGQAAVRLFWREFFRESPNARIEMEEIFAADDRCVMLWIYHWRDATGTQGHIRGVDVYTIKNDLIAEKLSYVKG